MGKRKTKTEDKKKFDARSDCNVEIILKNTGGIKLDINSKVESMFGNKNHDLLLELCKFYKIKNADIIFDDGGALPYTIQARFELAVKRLFPEVKKEYLSQVNKENNYTTTKDRLRRSRLYLPGNEPRFFINAGLHNPDGIILDLEDSVSPSEKDAAQLLVRNALRSVNFYGAERMVRINQLPKGLEDLKYIVPNNIHVILIPKCESEEQVEDVESEVRKLKGEHKITGNIYFMPIIESALGVIKSYEIASASDNNCALAVGLEDYTADIGAARTLEGKESFFARSIVVNAAKAAGIQAIDTVFSDVSDIEGLRESVIEAKGLGFEGKGCIHPRQIEIINKAFAPTENEIEKAKKIVKAFEIAKEKGLGVVSLGSKMIDAPVVKGAQRVIDLALLNSLITDNWRKE